MKVRYANFVQPTESRFMLDYQVYSRFHAGSEAFDFSTSRKAPYDRWPVSFPISTKMSDANLILLPPGIHGFFLKEKKWGTSHSLQLCNHSSSTANTT